MAARCALIGQPVGVPAARRCLRDNRERRGQQWGTPACLQMPRTSQTRFIHPLLSNDLRHRRYLSFPWDHVTAKWSPTRWSSFVSNLQQTGAAACCRLSSESHNLESMKEMKIILIRIMHACEHTRAHTCTLEHTRTLEHTFTHTERKTSYHAPPGYTAFPCSINRKKVEYKRKVAIKPVAHFT